MTIDENIVQPKIRLSNFVDNWNSYQIKDLLSGKGYIKGPSGSKFKVADTLDEGEYVVYEQRHVIHNHRDFRRFIDKEKYEKLKGYAVYPSDLLISSSGTVGKTSVIESNDSKGIVQSSVIILRLNNNLINPWFLKYYFETPEGFKSLVSNSEGSTRLQLSKKDHILDLNISVPSLEEQKEIIQLFNLIDDKINLLENGLNKYHDYVWGLLNDIMNQKYTKNPNWNKVALKDIGNQYTGISKKKDRKKDNYNYISNEFIDDIILNPSIFETFYIENIEKYNEVLKGDILFRLGSKSGVESEIAVASVLLDDIEDCYMSGGCCGYRLNSLDEYNPLFLAYYLRSHKFRKEVFKYIQGGSISSKEHLFGIEIEFPPIEEQNYFANLIYTLFEKEKSLEEQIEKLNEYKSGLLNKMFI